MRTQAQQTVAALNQRGIGRNDRVAIVLPNGAEMATAFVSVACGATTAPLNPAYRLDEFEFYLSDLNAKALIVEQGSESPAVAAADKLGIPVLRIVAGEAAGTFRFEGPPSGDAAANGGLAAAGRHRAGPAHVGHHVAAEDRAADPAQPVRVGTQHRHHAGADRR